MDLVAHKSNFTGFSITLGGLVVRLSSDCEGFHRCAP